MFDPHREPVFTEFRAPNSLLKSKVAECLYSDHFPRNLKGKELEPLARDALSFKALEMAFQTPAVTIRAEM